MTRSGMAVVFGGSGFLGRATVQALASRGWRVRVPTRTLEKTRALTVMGLSGQIAALLTSTRSDASVAAAVEGAEVVINLIGSFDERGRDSLQSIHVETAARIARLAKSAGAARFIQVSAFGSDKGSRSLYLKTKAAGEEAVRTFFPTSTVLRSGLLFGPHDRFFNLLALAARFSPFLPLFGDGSVRVQPVYVGDTADAIAHASEERHAVGCVFNLLGPQTYSLKDLAQVVLDVTRRRRFLLPVPWGVVAAAASALVLAGRESPLTPAMVRALREGVFTSSETSGLYACGIEPKRLEAILPTYLC